MASLAASYAKTGTQSGIGKAVRGSSLSAEADDAAFDIQNMISEDRDIEAVPILVQPDTDGFADARNLEKVNFAGWADGNPIQNGVAKLMCDL